MYDLFFPPTGVFSNQPNFYSPFQSSKANDPLTAAGHPKAGRRTPCLRHPPAEEVLRVYPSSTLHPQLEHARSI